MAFLSDWAARLWGGLPPEALVSILLAVLALALAMPPREAAPMMAAEEELARAGPPLLRLLGFAFCLIGGLFLTLGAEAATLTAPDSPAGLFLGAALFAGAGLRCLWLAGR